MAKDDDNDFDDFADLKGNPDRDEGDEGDEGKDKGTVDVGSDNEGQDALATFADLHSSDGVIQSKGDDDTKIVIVPDDYDPDAPEADVHAGEEGDSLDTDGEDDLKQYPQKVRARIKREADLKEAAREEKERLAAENAQLKKRIAESVKKDRAAGITQLQAEVDKARDEIQSARYNNDIEAEEKAREKQTSLIVKLERLKTEAERAPADEEIDDTTDVTPKQTAAPQVSGETQKWLDRNKWFNDPKYKAQAAAVRGIDRDINKETGLKSNDPKYFVELDRRIKEAGVRVPVVRPQAHTPSVARGGGQQPNGQRRGGTLTITRADQANMRIFGINPEDKDAVKEYLRNRK